MAFEIEQSDLGSQPPPSPFTSPPSIAGRAPKNSRPWLLVAVGVLVVLIITTIGLAAYFVLRERIVSKSSMEAVPSSEVLPTTVPVVEPVLGEVPLTSEWSLTSQREVEVWDAKNQQQPPRITWEPKDTWIRRIDILSYQDCQNVAGGDVAPLYDQEVDHNWGTFTTSGVWEMKPSLVGSLGDHGIYFIRVTATDGTWHMSEMPIYTIIDEQLTPRRIAEIKDSLSECAFVDSVANQQAYEEYLAYWETYKKDKYKAASMQLPRHPTIENDNRIISNLHQLRNLAEVYYDTNNASYVGFDRCVEAPSSTTCTGGLEEEVTALERDLLEESGGSALVVNVGDQNVCMSHSLSSVNSFLCIDNNGSSVEGSAAVCGESARCPQ